MASHAPSPPQQPPLPDASPPPPPAPPNQSAAAAPTLEVDAADVIRMVCQFLREQGLPQSLKALQEETNVTLNMVDNVASFTADVMGGRWDAVLPQLSLLKLPPTLLMRIYEQMAFELLEVREVDVVRALLRGTLPLLMLKQEEPVRYARLEHMASRGFDATEAYPEGGGKEGRRAAIARGLGEHLVAAPPSRLMSMLGQALRWQAHTGALPAASRLDVFRGIVPIVRDVVERPCTVSAGVIRGGAVPTASVFSPDGLGLVVGAGDGIIEIYDPDTMRIRKDLEYQSKDDFMMHDEAIVALAVSCDSQLLASASRDGKVKVWRIASGECVRRYTKAHGDGGASCLAFNRDGTQLLSGGFDGLVRIHGLRSGKLLKEFRGHTSFVNSVAYAVYGAYGAASAPSAGSSGAHDATGVQEGSAAGGVVVSASSDGTLRVWEVKASECRCVIKPPQASAATDVAVHTAIPVLQCASRSGGMSLVPVFSQAAASAAASSSGSDEGAASASSSEAASAAWSLLVGVRGGSVYLLSATGAVLRTFAHERSGASAEVVSVTVSPRGGWVYAVTEARVMFCFGAGSGRLAATVDCVGDKEVTGVAHHPLRSLVGTFGADGAVRLWQPSAAAMDE